MADTFMSFAPFLFFYRIDYDVTSKSRGNLKKSGNQANIIPHQITAMRNIPAVNGTLDGLWQIIPETGI